jgi:thermitase
MNIDHPDLAPGIVTGGYFLANNDGTATFFGHKQGSFPRGFDDHGSFCLGMAGARNNSEGGCGSAPASDLIAIGCLGDFAGTQFVGTHTTVARAIAYAADPRRQGEAAEGADIIVCSLGPNDGFFDVDSSILMAVENAANEGRNGLGIPIFWAVSNGSFDIAGDEVCSHPDVIAVGRSKHTPNGNGGLDEDEAGSSFGSQLAFLAPGVGVFSTYDSGFGTNTGTSFAAPLAAGVAALVLNRFGRTTMTRDELLKRLQDTCDKIGPLAPYTHHVRYGFGRINADRAVNDSP